MRCYSMANTGMCFFCMNCIYVHICVYLWHCWHMKSNVITVFSSERGSVFGRSVSFSHQRNATTWTNASLLPLRQGYSLHSYNPTKYPKLVHNQHTYFSMLLLFFYINKKKHFAEKNIIFSCSCPMKCLMTGELVLLKQGFIRNVQMQ